MSGGVDEPSAATRSSSEGEMSLLARLRTTIQRPSGDQAGESVASSLGPETFGMTSREPRPFEEAT